MRGKIVRQKWPGAQLFCLYYRLDFRKNGCFWKESIFIFHTPCLVTECFLIPCLIEAPLHIMLVRNIFFKNTPLRVVILSINFVRSLGMIQNINVILWCIHATIFNLCNNSFLFVNFDWPSKKPLILSLENGLEGSIKEPLVGISEGYWYCRWWLWQVATVEGSRTCFICTSSNLQNGHRS